MFGGGGRIVEVGWVCLSDSWVTRLVVVTAGAMVILIGGHSGVWFRGRGFNHLLSWRRRTGIYSWQEVFDIRGRELVWALRYARVFSRTDLFPKRLYKS